MRPLYSQSFLGEMAFSVPWILGLSVALIACICDWKRSLIPNRLTYPAVLVGMFVSISMGGITALKGSLIGLVLGAGCLTPLWLIGALGGGDVKVFGALGSILAFPIIIPVILYSFFLAVVWLSPPPYGMAERGNY